MAVKITNLYFKRRRKKRRNEKIKHVMQHVYESGFRNLSEEEHFLKHLLFLGRCASFNPTNFRNVLISFVHVRERERNGDREGKSMRGTSRAATALKFNLLLRDERVEIIMDGGWMMVGGR